MSSQKKNICLDPLTMEQGNPYHFQPVTGFSMDPLWYRGHEILHHLIWWKPPSLNWFMISSIHIIHLRCQYFNSNGHLRWFSRLLTLDANFWWGCVLPAMLPTANGKGCVFRDVPNRVSRGNIKCWGSKGAIILYVSFLWNGEQLGVEHPNDRWFFFHDVPSYLRQAFF